MKQLARRLVRGLGFDIVRYRDDARPLPSDITADDRVVLEQISPFTMTSIERQVSLIQTVRYLVHRGIQGCCVECGVWRGGSSMATALTLIQEGDTGRDLYLYDTFEGMTPPTAADKTTDGTSAQTHLDRDINGASYWCVADLDDVRGNMSETSYPVDRVHLVKGPVEETIPRQSPREPIALLRLDTDWYESTRHELIHLYPQLVNGGILVIDDYGHWAGARQAVDEYLSGLAHPLYLHRIDYTGRLLIKE